MTDWRKSIVLHNFREVTDLAKNLGKITISVAVAVV